MASPYVGAQALTISLPALCSENTKPFGPRLLDMVKLLDGARIDDEFIREVQMLAYKAKGLYNAPSREPYRSLVLEVHKTFARRLPRSEIDRLAMTPTFWQLQGDPGFVMELVMFEINQLAVRLDHFATELEHEMRHWEDAGHLVVPDTNVYIHALGKDVTIAGTDWRALAELPRDSDVTVILPVTVLDELDKMKQDKFRAQARRILREISASLDGDGSAAIQPWLRLQALVPSLDHVPLAVADNEIIDQTRQLRSRVGRGYRIRLLTCDFGMATRARMAKLEVQLLPQPE